MSIQPEHKKLQPQDLRQSLLSELDASRQAIIELSDEQLEQVAGGSLGSLVAKVTSKQGLKVGGEVVGKGLAGGAVSFGFSEFLKSTF
jgi:hypothetical protein